jgi:hypothetical protein
MRAALIGELQAHISEDLTIKWPSAAKTAMPCGSAPQSATRVPSVRSLSEATSFHVPTNGFAASVWACAEEIANVMVTMSERMRAIMSAPYQSHERYTI